MTTNPYSPLFRFASKFLKYFLLAILGFAIAYILSTIFGVVQIATTLLPFVINGFWRVGIVLLCLIAVVMILESLR